MFKALLQSYLFLLTFSAWASVGQSHKGKLSLCMTALLGPLPCPAHERKTKHPNQLLGGEADRGDFSWMPGVANYWPASSPGACRHSG